MPIVKLNGIQFHIQTLGFDKKRETETSPLIMVHGFGIDNLSTWYFSLAPALAAKLPVVLYDLRGHGLSEMTPTGYNLKSMADDLEHLCVYLKIDSKPINLVGYSYGGLVALHFTLRHLPLVQRLGLVEAPIPPFDFSNMAQFGQLSKKEIGPIVARQLLGKIWPHKRKIEKIKQDSTQEVGNKSLAEIKIQRNSKKLEQLTSQTSFLKEVNSEKNIPDSQLHQLTMPVQLIYGEQSKLRDIGSRFHSQIPKSSLIELPGTHYLPFQSPQQLKECILEFFGDQ